MQIPSPLPGRSPNKRETLQEGTGSFNTLGRGQFGELSPSHIVGRFGVLAGRSNEEITQLPPTMDLRQLMRKKPGRLTRK